MCEEKFEQKYVELFGAFRRECEKLEESYIQELKELMEEEMPLLTTYCEQNFISAKSKVRRFRMEMAQEHGMWGVKDHEVYEWMIERS